MSALYPRFASERLLAGETKVHLELPEVRLCTRGVGACAFTERACACAVHAGVLSTPHIALFGEPPFRVDLTMGRPLFITRMPRRSNIASGPVTVGVLPGKCPAFDVWGKTVNLASRMEVDFGWE